jgi:alpha-1,6-mannosyltransferase
MSSITKLAIGITLLTVGLFSIHFSIAHPIIIYTIIVIFASAIYLWVTLEIFKSELPKNFIYLAIGITFLLRISFITTTPIGSDDIYRYMWDGKVQVNGISPYVYAPESAELRHLHTELLPSSVNHQDMKTPYLPLSQWIFAACYILSGEAVWGFKLILLLSEVLTIIGLILLLKQLKISDKFVLLYALCPLPIIQFAIDAHIDAVGLPLLIFGLLLYYKDKVLPALLLIGLSISIKPVALVILPILFLDRKSWKDKLEVVAIPLLTVGIQFLPYVFSSNPFEGFLRFTWNWTFNGLIFTPAYLYYGDNQYARQFCAVLLVVSILLLYFSKKNLNDKIYFSVLLLLIFSPVVHPWYVAWLAVLVPFAQRWSGIVFAATVSLTSLTVLDYKMYGVWSQSPIVLIIENLPVVALLMFELWKKEGSTKTQQSLH